MENILNSVDVENMNESEVNRMENQLKIVKPKSKDTSRGTRTGNGVMTVINSNSNGKRFIFSNSVIRYLDNPDSIEIGFTEDSVVASYKLPENGQRFNLRKSGNKGVLYSYQLVKEITELFDLDFSNRVSMTFNDAEYIDLDYPMVKINIKNK